jgi:3-oxoacyl-[acyl-carrier-protein] synthase-3
MKTGSSMRINGKIGIGAVCTWLPAAAETPQHAVAAGRLDREDVAGTGVVCVPVSDGISAPDMAAAAADEVLRQAGVPAAQLDLLCHAWIYHQGHDFWSPAHYVAARLGADRAIPLGLQQMCNGGASGIVTAVTRVLADPEPACALVTTADRFALPGFDRWCSDYAVAYGDGATAALVRRCVPGQDALDLLSVAAVSAPSMEEMHRGTDPFSPAPRWLSEHVDARRTKRAFLAAGGMDRFREISREKVREVVTRALHEAGVQPDDPRLCAVLLPRLGPGTLELMYLPVIEDLVKAPPLILGESTGHLGAGDFIANLADLALLPVLADDGLAIVVGGGGGFSWTCAVVRHCRPPELPAVRTYDAEE